jgi:hypothetical protein
LEGQNNNLNNEMVPMYKKAQARNKVIRDQVVASRNQSSDKPPISRILSKKIGSGSKMGFGNSQGEQNAPPYKKYHRSGIINKGSSFQQMDPDLVTDSAAHHLWHNKRLDRLAEAAAGGDYGGWEDNQYLLAVGNYGLQPADGEGDIREGEEGSAAEHEYEETSLNSREGSNGTATGELNARKR